MYSVQRNPYWGKMCVATERHFPLSVRPALRYASSTTCGGQFVHEYFIGSSIKHLEFLDIGHLIKATMYVKKVGISTSSSGFPPPSEPKRGGVLYNNTAYYSLIYTSHALSSEYIGPDHSLHGTTTATRSGGWSRAADYSLIAG